MAAKFIMKNRSLFRWDENNNEYHEYRLYDEFGNNVETLELIPADAIYLADFAKLECASPAQIYALGGFN